MRASQAATTAAAAVTAAAASTANMSSRRRQTSVTAAAAAAVSSEPTKLTSGSNKLLLSNPHGGAGVASGLPEFNIDLGDLTQTPRRRVSAVPASTVAVYRTLRRILGLLTCFVAVSDTVLAVSDIVMGSNMMSGSEQWSCFGFSAGRAVFASGITGVVFCIGLVFTQYLATGNTVVHSSITAILMLASLGHTCSALPRLQLSYLAVGCTAKAGAYLLITGFGRLTTLIVAGAYYGLLNYYVCRFGEDNTTTSGYSAGRRRG